MFDKLFRGDNVSQKDPEGAGLGLYIAQAIIKQSGGRIWFNSTEGKGTVFYVAFPLSGMKQVSGSKELN